MGLRLRIGLCLAASLGPGPAVQPCLAEAAEEGTAPVNEQLESIIVTARRRNEPLQRTPVSVIALPSGDLEARSITNLGSLQNFVPNLTLAPSQNVGDAAGNAFIRGIGQEDFLGAAEPGVGFYVDGVYLARTSGTLMNVLDIDRIEVLRGPQGTLFGKNSIGGAINIITAAPQPEREGWARAILGNYARVELRGVANEPLSNRLLARLAVGLVRRDGYLRRLLPPYPGEPYGEVDSAREGNDNSLAGRLQLRWLASDNLTVDLALDGSRKRNNQSATHLAAIDTGDRSIMTINGLIRAGKLPGPELATAILPDSRLQSLASGGSFTHQDFWGASATLAGDLGGAALKTVLAYRGLSSRARTDIDGLYFNILQSEFRERQNQLSGELQVTGMTERLDYTAGLFAFREKAASLPKPGILSDEILYTCNCFYVSPAIGPMPLTGDSRVMSESYAAYAQGTYRLNGRLSATLGGRYSHERKSIAGRALRVDPATLQPTGQIVGTGSNRGAWDSFTYRAGLEYQATPELMLYGSTARGYKSGGFNARLAPNLLNLGLTAFAPETALTYEAGLRSHWLGRRLRLNATVFHTDYRDIQLRRQVLFGGQLVTLVENAARARIRGIEAEVTAGPIRGLTLSGAYGHVAPRYLDTGNAAGITVDSRFQRTPRHSFFLAADYELPVSFGLVQLYAAYSYRSKEQFQTIPSLVDQPGYGLLQARLALRAAEDRWSMALFGTNLTDERYHAAGRGALAIVGLPRMIGVELKTRY